MCYMAGPPCSRWVSGPRARLTDSPSPPATCRWATRGGTPPCTTPRCFSPPLILSSPPLLSPSRRCWYSRPPPSPPTWRPSPSTPRPRPSRRPPPTRSCFPKFELGSTKDFSGFPVASGLETGQQVYLQHNIYPLYTVCNTSLNIVDKCFATPFYHSAAALIMVALSHQRVPTL